jgi:hypothetical protein
MISKQTYGEIKSTIAKWIHCSGNKFPDDYASRMIEFDQDNPRNQVLTVEFDMKTGINKIAVFGTQWNDPSNHSAGAHSVYIGTFPLQFVTSLEADELPAKMWKTDSPPPVDNWDGKIAPIERGTRPKGKRRSLISGVVEKEIPTSLEEWDLDPKSDTLELDSYYEEYGRWKVSRGDIIIKLNDDQLHRLQNQGQNADFFEKKNPDELKVK